MTKPADAMPYHRSTQQPPMLDSRKLLGDKTEVLIRHQGAIYRLRHTRQGRLILTK